MRNHTELSLSGLRRYIIRYGAKMMDAFESDLWYDCNGVERLEVGDSVFWMVSEQHTYLYSAKEIAENNLNIGTIAGNRANFRIECVKGKCAEKEYSMIRVYDDEIKKEVNRLK